MTAPKQSKEKEQTFTFRIIPSLESYGARGDERAIATLLRAARSRSTNVRLTALRVIKRLAPIEAIPVLCRQLEGHDPTDSWSQAEAALALGTIGARGLLSTDAIDCLVERCEQASSATVRAAAAEALAYCVHSKGFSRRLRRKAIAVLAQLETERYCNVRRRAAASLDYLDWSAEDLDARIRHLIAHEDWSALSDHRGTVTATIVSHLKSNHELPAIQQQLVQCLGRAGTLQSAKVVIRWLFAHGTLIETEDQFSNWCTAMNPLFGDYTTLILRAACYVDKKTTTFEHPTRDEGTITHTFDTIKAEAALREVCQLSGPIAKNVLVEAARKADVEIVTGSGWNEWGGGESHGTLNFATCRAIAAEGLERRRQQKLAPSAYLRRSLWRIDTE